MIISVANDFSKTPGGRKIEEGPNSGELFRQDVLEPAYRQAVEKGDKLVVDLDGCISFPPSFIEEAFGGLVRTFKDRKILDNVTIICEDEPSLIDEAYKKITEAIKHEKI